MKRYGNNGFLFFFNVRCVIVIHWFAVLFLIFVWPFKGPLEYDGWIHDVTSCLLWRHRWMTLYAKPINRPFLLEGWFEKPKHRLFGHVLQVFQIWYNLCWELTSTWTFKIYLHNTKKKETTVVAVVVVVVVVVVVTNFCKKCNYYTLYYMKIKGAVKGLENDRRGRPRDSFNDVQDIQWKTSPGS